MRNEYLALSAQCLEGGESAAVDFIINRHVSTRDRFDPTFLILLHLF